MECKKYDKIEKNMSSQNTNENKRFQQYFIHYSVVSRRRIDIIGVYTRQINQHIIYQVDGDLKRTL